MCGAKSQFGPHKRRSRAKRLAKSHTNVNLVHTAPHERQFRAVAFAAAAINEFKAEKAEWADKPGSVVGTAIYLRRTSPHVFSAQPGCTEGRPYRIPICVCSRWGLPSRDVTAALVRFYRTVSAFLKHPCPDSRSRRNAWESSFLWHFPSGRPAQPLAGILPLGARTFLTR